jgi:hypothetical protein
LGTIETIPSINTLLGAFDNDQFFDIRLMPHRHGDEYKAPNGGFFAPPGNPAEPVGTPPWTTNAPPLAGPSDDGKTESTKLNDIFLDGFQGSVLLRPLIHDLPYTPVGLDDVPLNDNTLPSSAKLTRCTLHCEAEGNFWQAMKDYAPLLGALVGGGAAAGAAVGAAAGWPLAAYSAPLAVLSGPLSARSLEPWPEELPEPILERTPRSIRTLAT